ncbi:MAG: sigma-70 family RNA polymerase sigma factor [Acidobacteriota bacterium]|nr:sigma-70 family RNA polymerase sigma factor [Acidobacteriota bacterium]
MTADERDLVTRLKHGDNHALQVLFERYHPLLYKTIYYRAGDDQLSQDLVQETFLKIWARRSGLKPDLPFFPLLAKISRNLLQDHFKHQQVRGRHRETVRLVTEREVTGPDDDLKQKMLETKIREVVTSKMPARCREVFSLSRGGGLKNAQIAELMGISKKTVENQLNLALKTLRKHLRDYL